jgi:hypothetical protein
MTPREKSLELVITFADGGRSLWDSRACSLVTVDQIINDIDGLNEYPENMPQKNFWAKVRNELNQIDLK